MAAVAAPLLSIDLITSPRLPALCACHHPQQQTPPERTKKRRSSDRRCTLPVIKSSPQSPPAIVLSGCSARMSERCEAGGSAPKWAGWEQARRAAIQHDREKRRAKEEAAAEKRKNEQQTAKLSSDARHLVSRSWGLSWHDGNMVVAAVVKMAQEEGLSSGASSEQMQRWTHQCMEKMVTDGEIDQRTLCRNRLRQAVPQWHKWPASLTDRQIEAVVQHLQGVHSLMEMLQASQDLFRRWAVEGVKELAEHEAFRGDFTKQMVAMLAWIVPEWSWLSKAQKTALAETILSVHSTVEVLVATQTQPTLKAWAIKALKALQEKECEHFSTDNQVLTHLKGAVLRWHHGSSYPGGKSSKVKLSDEQMRVISQKLSEVHTVFEVLLDNQKSLDSWIRDVVKELVEQGCKEFSCPICFDSINPFTPGNMMWRARAKSNENWAKRPCEHWFCCDCVKSWCESGIESMQHHIRCPAEGCSYTLWKDDIRGLVSPATFKAFEKNRNANYKEHLNMTLTEDDGGEFKKWLRKHARPCPSCHVIVSRSDGCDDMRCVCGCTFCYQCGRKQCKCGRKRVNIWDIAVSRANK